MRNQSQNKNKLFIQIFLSFFLLFFLVLLAFSYNVNNKMEKEIQKENKKFVNLILATSEAHMEFLENYMLSFRRDKIFLDFITSEEYSPSDSYNLQKRLYSTREVIGKDNVDIGIMNIDKNRVIFTEDSYTVSN